MNQSGPIPTQLVLLSDLPKLPPSSKVRFLGCVTKYSIKTATLTLEHNYPTGNAAKALVDIDLVLGTVKSHETQIGEWLNVMGYIQIDPTPTRSLGINHDVTVQAILLWSSGSLQLEDYEQSLDRLKT